MKWAPRIPLVPCVLDHSICAHLIHRSSGRISAVAPCADKTERVHCLNVQQCLSTSRRRLRVKRRQRYLCAARWSSSLPTYVAFELVRRRKCLEYLPSGRRVEKSHRENYGKKWSLSPRGLISESLLLLKDFGKESLLRHCKERY